MNSKSRVPRHRVRGGGSTASAESCFAPASFISGCPRELWADRIERVAQAGYHALDVYIPWNYHEPERATPAL